MARQKLGQHFLNDPEVIRQILKSANLTAHDRVLEIGPGQGAITTKLARQAEHVVAVELDRTLAQRLPRLDNLHVLQEDILEVDLRSILSHPAFAATDPEAPATGWKVVANLPYYITTPIIQKLLDYCFAWEQSQAEHDEGSHVTGRIDEMILMVQHEVAERMAASACREAGSLSYFVQYHAEVSYLFRVKPESFSPPPQVDSAVIQLKPYRVPPVEAPRERLFQTIRTAFQERRKMLKRSLRNLAQSQGFDLEAVLAAAEVNPTRRPETLTLEEFAAIARAQAATT